MSNHNVIRFGDIVRVNFNTAQVTLGSKLRVVYAPVATGGSWIFKDDETGELHYVSEGCTITKRDAP